MRPISFTRPGNPEVHIARDMKTYRELKAAGWVEVARPVVVKEGEAKK